MEASRVTLLTLLCAELCSQQWIFGAEVEMKVRPGENIIIYSDCYGSSLNAAWFRKSSDGNQDCSLISADATKCYSRYSEKRNESNSMNDLIINKVTESDQGHYYCGVKNKDGGYSYGNTSTRLIVLDKAPPSSREPSEPSGGENGSPGWSCSWQLLVSVSAVCVLLSSLFSSIGVYYLCRKNVKAQFKVGHGGSDGRQAQRRDELQVAETEVCYSSLDFQNIKKKKQKQRVQHSDFSMYSEVRTQRT